MTCNHTEGPGHDCAYVDARNALIPAAERLTDQAVGPLAPDATPFDVARWGATFLKTMDKLWRARENFKDNWPETKVSLPG